MSTLCWIVNGAFFLLNATLYWRAVVFARRSNRRIAKLVRLSAVIAGDAGRVYGVAGGQK